MKPLNLQEFAEQLRTTGDDREVDFANMILQLLDLENDIAEPYSELCDDLDHYTDKSLHGNARRQLEWVGDRSDMLKEIEDAIAEAGRAPTGTDDTTDVVKRLLELAAPKLEYDL